MRRLLKTDLMLECAELDERREAGEPPETLWDEWCALWERLVAGCGLDPHRQDVQWAATVGMMLANRTGRCQALAAAFRSYLVGHPEWLRTGIRSSAVIMDVCGASDLLAAGREADALQAYCRILQDEYLRPTLSELAMIRNHLIAACDERTSGSPSPEFVGVAHEVVCRLRRRSAARTPAPAAQTWAELADYLLTAPGVRPGWRREPPNHPTT